MHATTVFASAAAAALFSLVEAHGIVHEIAVEGGRTLTSPLIGSNGDASNFWLVSDNSPVHDFNSDEMTCGRVAKKGSATPEVAAGSTLTFKWNSGYSNEQTGWPHNTGPMFFYMAKCDGSCSSIGASTKWTKMAEIGLVNGVWKQADLTKNKGVQFTIPKDLEEGNYVIRHEVVNLAIAEPEMFPQCSNFKVTGGGSTSLSSSKQVTFPGAYKASDAGFISGAPIYEIHDAKSYRMPGPALFGNGGSSDGGDDAPAPSPSKSDPKPTTSKKDNATTSSKDSDSPAPTKSDPAPVNNGGAPSSAAASSTADSEPTTPTGSDAPAAPSASDAPAPPATSDPAAGAACATAWTECNAKYKGTAEDQKNYKCQIEFTTCVEAQMTKTAANSTNAKRMHRRRRALHGAAAAFSH